MEMCKCNVRTVIKTIVFVCSDCTHSGEEREEYHVLTPPKHVQVAEQVARSTRKPKYGEEENSKKNKPNSLERKATNLVRTTNRTKISNKKQENTFSRESRVIIQNSQFEFDQRVRESSPVLPPNVWSALEKNTKDDSSTNNRNPSNSPKEEIYQIVPYKSNQSSARSNDKSDTNLKSSSEPSKKSIRRPSIELLLRKSLLRFKKSNSDQRIIGRRSVGSNSLEASLALTRHLSNYNLVKEVNDSAISLSTERDRLESQSHLASFADEQIQDSTTRGYYSVADVAFGRKRSQSTLSCSSSSSDEFQSTRCDRAVLQEKFRGVAKEKSERSEPRDDKSPKKTKEKPSKKNVCNCHWRGRHHKCKMEKVKKRKNRLHQTGSKSERWNEVSITETVSDSISGKSEEQDENTTEQLIIELCSNVGTQQIKPDSTGYDSNVSCYPDMCNAYHKVDNGREQESNLSLQASPCKIPSDKKVRDKIESSRNFKTVDSVQSDQPRMIETPCCLETCENLKRTVESKQKSFRKRKKRKKIVCAPIICKIPVKLKDRNKALKMTYALSRASRDTKRPCKRRLKTTTRYVCRCFDLGKHLDVSKESDLWEPGHQRQMPLYSLDLKPSVMTGKECRKCSGADQGRNKCSCLSCRAKAKPWRKLMRRANAIMDIPYPLTSEEMKRRTQMTSNARKIFRTKYHWPEIDLNTLCKMRDNCGVTTEWKGNEENKRRWNWFEKTTEKNSANKNLDTSRPGRFGYFVKIKEGRYVKEDGVKELQMTTEKAVYCQWMQDSADIKVNHFLNNMPSLQTCTPLMKEIDEERRTCYNAKLLDRLADLVEFSKDPDRRLHEFSFLPKIIKLQEPQLLGDPNTEIPDVKPVRDYCSFPTIYRDLFKNNDRELRAAMDSIIPPLQWTDNMGFWEMKVSIESDDLEINRNVIKCLDYNDSLCHAINVHFCAGRYRLHLEAFVEVIRQELLENPERAFILRRIRQEFLMDLLIYDGGLEMSLVSTTHLWKHIEENRVDGRRLVRWETEIERLKLAIKEITASCYELEKRVEDLGTVREYLEEDEWKLIKRINRNLESQNEAIHANLMFDLD